MRNLIFAINISIDGCCDHTKMTADAEVHDYFTRLLRDEIDLMVFGRKTYELMVPYWPDIAKNQSETKSENDFARAFDPIPRIVFSRSLASAGEKTKIVRANLREEILKLKQQPGKKILAGGVSLTSQLIELGLVDEFRFVVQPIIAGEGARLLQGITLPQRLQLRLADSKPFKSGGLALHYMKQ
jgi:dihydrofolate reductase